MKRAIVGLGAFGVLLAATSASGQGTSGPPRKAQAAKRGEPASSSPIQVQVVTKAPGKATTQTPKGPRLLNTSVPIADPQAPSTPVQAQAAPARPQTSLRHRLREMGRGGNANRAAGLRAQLLSLIEGPTKREVEAAHALADGLAWLLADGRLGDTATNRLADLLPIICGPGKSHEERLHAIREARETLNRGGAPLHEVRSVERSLHELAQRAKGASHSRARPVDGFP